MENFVIQFVIGEGRKIAMGSESKSSEAQEIFDLRSMLAVKALQLSCHQGRIPRTVVTCPEVVACRRRIPKLLVVLSPSRRWFGWQSLLGLRVIANSDAFPAACESQCNLQMDINFVVSRPGVKVYYDQCCLIL
ncbi:hypothetical protein [Agrobacterium sp. NCPPB 925]|uniref:hypothetical protein n=1 Tax=Agrobacterium sp. NCPPB 925 TaxID=1631629 RepID=UPI00131401A7|nr:hypothetical protein [Agrobacterium sp. NCPPB 925]